jgi:hypothetical protein
MSNLTISLSSADDERLERILRKSGQTSYAFGKEAILKTLRDAEEDLGLDTVSQSVLALVDQLRERKWSLYQMQDYSDTNHRKWLEGRNPRSSKREVQEAVAYFRKTPVRL